MSSERLLFPSHDHYWFETLRVLGHTAYGGADVGEVLTAAADITAGDPNSWHQAWSAMAERIAATAQHSQDTGHPVSARDSWLRASTYHRISDFYLHADPDDPRVEHAHRQAAACFASHAALAEHPMTAVRVPFEGAELTGWLSRAHRGRGPRPLLMLHNGFDGAAEEMHFLGGLAGAERGFHTLTFDGPGQPSALRDHGFAFRPNWETVVSPVLDHVLHTHGQHIDQARIALLGVSLGGVLAPRAAAHDSRIRALICVDGIYDASSTLADLLRTDREGLERLAADPKAEAQLVTAAQHSPILSWVFDHGRYAMGVNSRTALLGQYLRYHLREGLAEQIRCPTLVCEASDDIFFGADDGGTTQPRELMRHLTCPATLLTFTSAEGAAAHGHAGAEKLAMTRILNWLEETLATT